MDGFRQLGVDVVIHPLAKVVGRATISIGSHVVIDDFVFIGAHTALTIGNYVHIATHASISGGGRCLLHDFSSVSSGARVLTGTDDFSGGGLVGPTVPPDLRQVARGEVVLESHVLVGANVVILPGVRIGEGSAIGAGSVVTRSLPPWGIYAGTPAKLVRPRPAQAIRDAEANLYRRYGHPLQSFRSMPVNAAS
jgi:galactoside O-acetyltransferase